MSSASRGFVMEKMFTLAKGLRSSAKSASRHGIYATDDERTTAAVKVEVYSEVAALLDDTFQFDSTQEAV